MYRLGAEQLYDKWEAFSLNSISKSNADGTEEVKLNEQTLEKFKDYLKEGLKQSVKAGPKQSEFKLAKNGTKKLDINNISSYMDFLQPKSSKTYHKRSLKSLQPSSFDPSSNLMELDQASVSNKSMLTSSNNIIESFKKRTDSGEIESVFNSNLAPFVDSSQSLSGQSRPKVEIALHPNCLQNKVRYMYEKVPEKALAIDERINSMGLHVLEGREATDVVDPQLASQSPVFTYGRIVSESEQKLNETSVLLQVSRQVGYGNHVRLNLNGVSEYSIFPGQVLGVEGINQMGRDLFTASKIINPSIQSMESSSTKELHKYQYDANYGSGYPLKLITAAGPFCLEGTAEFEALKELLSKAETEQPDVLIVLGPFVDDQTPMASSGELPLLEADLFSVFVEIIAEFLKNLPKCKVILLPSPRDAMHPWLEFPQPALSLREYLKTTYFQSRENSRVLERIYCLPNPCIFKINEIFIGASTCDVLHDLSQTEISRGDTRTLGAEDRIGCLARHVLAQRSFYPLDPPPVDSRTLIDYKHLSNIELHVKPDVMILPSVLPHFAKSVEETLVINPGKLVIRKKGGTFSIMTVYPIDEKELNNTSSGIEEESDQYMYHGVDQRARVDVIRI